MSAKHEGGNAIPVIEREEHRSIGGVNAKAVVLYGYDYTNNALQPLGVVESLATPGTFGLIVLNSDGSALSTGGGTTTTSHLLLEGAGNFLTETGDILTMEA